MKGFTEYTYKDHPVFVRSEYEDSHTMDGELERIADLTGVYYDSFGIAIHRMYASDESLVYRNYSRELDDRLRGGSSGSDLWVPLYGGWVHKITGELVYGYRPDRDSYPCWCLRETNPMSEMDMADINNKARGALLLLGLEWLASLLSGEPDETESQDD